MKRTVLVFGLSLAGIAVIVVVVYALISMNNTIATLNDKLDQQSTVISELATPSAAPTPTPDLHLNEISELEILYSQKESLVKQYEDLANELKDLYSNNDDFTEIYIICSTTEFAKNLYYNRVEVADGCNVSPFIIEAATRAAYYTIYVSESKQLLIEAEGLINLIKQSYSEADYVKAKRLFDSIVKPEI